VQAQIDNVEEPKHGPSAPASQGVGTVMDTGLTPHVPADRMVAVGESGKEHKGGAPGATRVSSVNEYMVSQSSALSLTSLALGHRRVEIPRAKLVPVGTSTGRVYPPGLASELSSPQGGSRTSEPLPAPVQIPGPPPTMLVQEALVALESAVCVQFTAIVTDRGFKSGRHADQYTILSLAKFLQAKSLNHAHYLFCIEPMHIQTVVERMRERPGLAEHRRTAHFMVSDGSCTNLTGLKLPEEVHSFLPGTCVWKGYNPNGTEFLLPPISTTLRVFVEAESKRCTLHSMASSQVLRMKAGIHQAAISLLLDTGASANFISGRLARALDLPVQPDSQGLQVIMGDGSSASITGTVITPLCIGRYRAKVEFLVTDLNPEFDAVLGFTWLRRNCDLHLSKGILAFRNGTKVTCVRIPTLGTTEPARMRWQSGSAPASLKSTIRGSLREYKLPADHSGPNAVKGSGHLLSSMQLAKLMRKGGQAFLLYLDVAATQAKVKGADKMSPIIDQLLKEFEEVFNDPPGLPPMRTVAHVAPLTPGSRPPYRRNYRMIEAERDELKKQLAELLEKGLIRPSVSPFGSPVIFVRKPNGELRLCIDYRAVNKLTVRNRYPLPRIDDLLDQLKGAKCFSSMDLKAGYNQIRIHEDDVEKTAITTPFGHWEYLVLPMGMANAPSIFMALMNDVFKGMEHFCLVYLDDVLVYSNSPEEHANHLRMVLARLREHQLYAKRSKCVFAQRTLKFLGHILSADGVRVDPEKTQVLQDWKTPSNVTEVR
jgi:Reverse transcriptase (RNA-dependent DNA polymerase)/gag-polyprotein putative aspartyl protease